MKRTLFGKLSEFFDGKGFYITLILCAAAIGISGYVLFFGARSAALDDELNIPDAAQMSLGPDASDAIERPITTEIPDYARHETEVVMADEYAASVAGDADIPAKIEAPDVSANTSIGSGTGDLLGDVTEVTGSADIPAEPVTTSAPDVSVSAPFFVWPISGEVLNDFSIDELVFNSTTEDWRVHPGIDISAPAGAHIGAIGDGVVEDVYEDEMMGWTVVINHGDGLRSVSCGLMSGVTVDIGDTVRAGETIGGIGGTAELESMLPSHLHLELIGDGAHIDPLEVLP